MLCMLSKMIHKYTSFTTVKLVKMFVIVTLKIKAKAVQYCWEKCSDNKKVSLLCIGSIIFTDGQLLLANQQRKYRNATKKDKKRLLSKV